MIKNKYEIGAMLILVTIFAFAMGFAFPKNKEPKKKYPIEVQSYWSTNGYSSYPTMECDSIKGDTLWKDGVRIVNKNIINVTFQ